MRRAKREKLGHDLLILVFIPEKQHQCDVHL